MNNSKAYARTQALFMSLRTALELEKSALYQKGRIIKIIMPARTRTAKFFKIKLYRWVLTPPLEVHFYYLHV
jgi:hypothetical protein